MKKWTTIAAYCLMTIAAASLSLFVFGCASKQPEPTTPEQPAAEEAEHPKAEGEHPKAEGEHPKAEGEHPKGEKPEGEHPAEDKPADHPSEHPE